MRHNSSCNNQLSDGKWRPFPLLLGAVYKVQNMVSSTIGDTESEEIKFFKGDLVRMLGYYWHLIMAADSTIRPGLEDMETETDVRKKLEANTQKYADTIGLDVSQVTWVWSSELERTRVHVSEYTPDHVVTIDHQHHLIILTILGTRVFPSPQPMDIMMDLMATSKPFLHGKAHAGLAWGAENIVKVVAPLLKDQLRNYQGYRILILGYSLGAGLAQLVSLDCKRHIAREH